MTRVTRFLVFGGRDARFDIGEVAAGGGMPLELPRISTSIEPERQCAKNLISRAISI
jgi:hypothetical protein